GVRVNALLPGGTDTPMGQVVASTPEARDHVRSLHALGRLAAPEEIARSALYLASDAASFTTGAVLLADGGASIYRG
ncbi:MAG: SDR family oxidoreductase, partial [Nannocystaceae bacterium]